MHSSLEAVTHRSSPAQQPPVPPPCPCNQIYKTPSSLHTASINSVAWAPQELGLLFATAASDGSIGIVEHTGDGNWHTTTVRGSHVFLSFSCKLCQLQRQACCCCWAAAAHAARGIAQPSVTSGTARLQGWGS